MTSYRQVAAGLALVSMFILAPGIASAADVPKQAAYGRAPEFTDIERWLNSQPLTLSNLRGKVVLVDFWTYACVNCVHTLPHLSAWHQRYRDQGLVIVGVHTPELPVEGQTRNVQAAIQRFGIKYPVAQDNRHATWKAYDNRYWPTSYLIDRQGSIVYKHVGEGRYDETENAIRALLNADGESPKAGRQNQLRRSPPM